MSVGQLLVVKPTDHSARLITIAMPAKISRSRTTTTMRTITARLYREGLPSPGRISGIPQTQESA